MPPKRNTSSMDLSRASPVIQQPMNIGNDPGSSTKGVGTTSAGLKSKRQPLVRSGGSGSNSGSQQSLLGFSSRKNAPVTPEKKKVSGLKRKVEEVGDEGVVNPETTVHPLFARKAEEPMVLEPVQSVDVDSKEGVRSATIEGISGVPTGWDPLLLTGSQPTKTMEQNLTLDNVHSSSLDLTPDEQAEQTEALQPGTHRNRGLAFRKAMLSADQRIKAIRETKPPIGKGKTGAGAKGKTGKGKGGLDPNDKRWSKVYKESWKAMGGDHIAPIHTTPQTHTKIHHILRAFDLSPQYGPCVGISRLARWERAKAWGLAPPEEIREILETPEGAEDTSYRETVFEGTGIYCSNA
ncbi:hypothetical protein QFC20_006160 [Naganishia adeliensis]|uniref:Uncharacterized protein n=1 Tax=Naganishia adeliensis TaxID=92952 RepID=A0ACC2VEM5_9TREE|nr:hypothetical protein QFC20_006160 [Naganishia adeliensis]